MAIIRRRFFAVKEHDGKAFAKRMLERWIDGQFAQNRAFPGARKKYMLTGTDAK